MVKREVAYPRFYGLLAFGAGVAVGANWPRASNFVGFVLQRLGLELTDLTLWMWDPEKSAASDAEIAPVKRGKAKRAQRLIQDGSPTSKRVDAKVKTSVSPENHQGGQGARRVTRRRATNGHEPWIGSESLNGSTARTNGKSGPLIKSGAAGDRGGRRTTAAANGGSPRPVRGTVRTPSKKPKRATVKSDKISSRAGGRKMNTFPDVILPSEAALN